MANVVFWGFALFGLGCLVYGFYVPPDPETGLRVTPAFLLGFGFIALAGFLRRLLKQQERGRDSDEG